jgi:enoyl-[acyl-carrier-protein] reductase (NADH)
MFAFEQHSLLGRGVTLDELGGSALSLLSDLSGGVAASHVDPTTSSRCRGQRS